MMSCTKRCSKCKYSACVVGLVLPEYRGGTIDAIGNEQSSVSVLIYQLSILSVELPVGKSNRDSLHHAHSHRPLELHFESFTSAYSARSLLLRIQWTF